MGFFHSLGIIYQSSCTATPQQNGIAECKHRHHLNVARALMFQDFISIWFWDLCILATCYLINLSPTILLKGKTIYEFLFGKQPDVEHLRSFGCLTFATDVTNHDKFGCCSIPTVMMGSSLTWKGYRFYNLTSH